MSDRSFTGQVNIEDMGPSGMITVRADLTDPAVAKALSLAQIEVPTQGGVKGNALWMSPDELMIFTAHGAAEAQTNALISAFGDTHSLVVNVSDARTAFRLTGEDARIREVLAKLSPADLRATSLPVGRVRRTRLAQVPAAFWYLVAGEANLICFRSVSDYVFNLLSNAAAEGSEVDIF